MKNLLLLTLLFINFQFLAQKEVICESKIDKVTVFFQGAQMQHSVKKVLQLGRQFVVFEKLTDFIDPNSVQVKADGDLTILSVKTRKNFEDLKMTNERIEELTTKRKTLDLRNESLRNEYEILSTDKNLLMKNRELKGNTEGLKVEELKQAYAFMHTELTKITERQSAITRELEDVTKQINRIDQEILSQRSKPVINYTEIVVELEVKKNTTADFAFNYITPNASWTPYYDLRSNGIGQPVVLQAKGLVNQTTGIEWKDIDLVLSTNDPYNNTLEPELNPWYISYYNYAQQYQTGRREIPEYDYSGEKLRGEVIDAETGEPLAFAKITFPNQPNVMAITDFDGKFEVTVPKGAQYVNAEYLGYNYMQSKITGPYMKFFLNAEKLKYRNVEETVDIEDRRLYEWDNSDSKSIDEVMVMSVSKEDVKRMPKIRGARSDAYSITEGVYSFSSNTVSTEVTQKDLRVEYAIDAKFTIPSDGSDQRISIAEHVMPANYEYHSVPKVDPSVYLVAQISGWEKLNLLNGESNIYFDGTYIGKSYVDAKSLKDTLTFSLGKDNKVQIERKRISELSSNKTIGSRKKFEVSWEITVRNNGGASIPVKIKDQFPISQDSDIKVKQGEYNGGKLDDQTQIITWEATLATGQKVVFVFDYKVDYNSSKPLVLE